MRIFFFLIVFAISINLFGQKITETDSIAPRFRSVDSTPVQGVVVLNRQSRTDSLLTSVLDRQDRLNQENEIFRTTIDANSNLFSGISTLFTIVSILLTIIIVALPIVNYFLVLKPNKEIVRKVGNIEADVLRTMEGNFEIYFEKLRSQKTENILSLLNDRSKMTEVQSYFILNGSDNLEEKNVQKIIEFLSLNNEVLNAGILHSAVIKSGFQIAEKYYKSIFENDDNLNIPYAVEYLVRNNFENHVTYISKIIKASENEHILLLQFFEHIYRIFIDVSYMHGLEEQREIGVKYLKLLFDNEVIVQSVRNHDGGWFDNEYIKGTKYYKRYVSAEN